MPRIRFPMFVSSRLLVTLIVGLIVIALALPVQPVHAASITVNTTADIVAVDGLCSLREAITNANNDAATNVDCAPGSGADTISFLINGTFTLTGGGSLVIADTVTLNGNGSATTIIEADANANVAAFRVFTVSTGTLTLDAVQVRNGGNDSTFASNGGCITVFTNAGLTLQNGALVTGCRTTAPADGAAINAGTGTTVTITGSTVQNNISGGNGGVMQANGVVNITNSTINNNSVAATSAGNGFGGAIACLGGCTLTVTGSTFTGNSAVNTVASASGGAIYIGASAADHSIVDSTFTNNSVSGVGSGSGGAIYKASTTALTVSGSVFTGNSATTLGGAIYNNQGTITVTSSRIESNTAPNGGAYYTVNGTAGATDSLTGSCIVGNSATAVVDIEVSSDLTATGNWWGTSWGPQIVAAGGGSAISGGDRISGDGVATSGDSIADVDVGLTNAGAADGSSVPTGNWLTSAPTVAGAPCASASWTPPTLPDVSISPVGFTVNEGSNANLTITRTGSTASALTVTLNITLVTGTLEADYTLTPASGTISAQSGNNVTVTIPAGSATLNINLAAVDDVDAEEANTLILTLLDQAAYNLGAPTASLATIPANDTVVTNLNDSGDGSLRQAITNANAFPSSDTITFTTSGTINLASNLPDLANNGTLTINGGGVITLVPVSNTGYRVFTLASGAQVTLNGLALTAALNTYISDGGLIYINSGALTVNNSSFAEGSAGNGGAIYNNSGTVLVTGTQFFNNTATNGGSIYNQTGQVTVTASTFDSNLTVAALNGGAIYNASGTVTITNSTLRNLGSAGHGAGIYNAGTLFVYDTTFAGNRPNSAANTADLYNSGTATVYNSILADQARGANCTNTGSITIQNTLIEDGSCGITNGVNGNLTGDPDLNASLIPNATSPVVDAGNDALIPSGITTDLAGNARSQGARVDLGAYETAYAPQINVTATTPNAAELGPINGTFQLTRTGALGALTVTFAISGTATQGTDYTLTDATATTLTTTVDFPAGVASVDVAVNPLVDTDAEGNETVSFTLVDGAAYDLGASANAVVTIADAPILSIGNAALAEGDSGTTVINLTVSLNSPATQTILVDYGTVDGTATTADGDYVPTGGTLTFLPGDSTADISVTINGDTTFEANETFKVSLINPLNAVLSTSEGTGTITNDDTQPNVFVDDVTLTEGDAGTTNFTFTVSLDAPAGVTATVDYATSDSTATQPGDYTTAGGSIVFAPGETSHPVTILVNGDLEFENNETFFVNLLNLINLTGGDIQGQGTITNDDAQPSISIDDVTQNEGNSGTTAFTFTVSLSAASGKSTFVDFAVADDTATAGSDYTDNSVTHTLLFPAGTTTQTITIDVNGDTTPEANETFFVNLSNPVNASLSDNQGLGSIANDDGVPSISIDDVTLAEGDAGTVTYTFTVSLDVASAQTITVDYATADDTATTADSDYAAGSGTLTFAPGITTQPVAITVNGDSTAEPDETFFVNLATATNAVIGDSQGLGTITNDDAVSLSLDDVTVTEGDSGTTNAVFTVSLSGLTTFTVTVDFTTTDGTALGGSDFTSTSGSLTFTPGVTTQTITVPVLGDLIAESSETYTVDLTNAVNATLSDAQGLGTINDNDTAGVTVSPGGALLTTEVGGTATFTLVLTSQPTADVTISLTASDATEATAAPSPLVFTNANWNTPQTVTVTGVDDPNADGDQASQVTFAVSSPDAAYNGLVIPAVQVTTVDDDTAGITVSPAAFTASEGFRGSYQIGLLTPPSDGNPVTVLVTFDAADLTVNGGSTPFLLTFSDTTPQTIPFTVLINAANNASRTATISQLVSASTAPEYPVGLARPVAITINETAVALPMPPPSPTCESENLDPNAVIRTGIPNALIFAINCRVLYYNSHPTDWLGQALYSEANLGLPGLLELGVQQAVDIFSPPPSSLNYFDGGAVFCLRGSGTLIWLAASQSPRHAEIIGSYTVAEFSGFTCATLFEPGTLILVGENPLD